MKFFICLAVMAIGASAISEEELISKYRQYQEEFEKSYRSPLEYRHRLGIFKQNLQEIEEHNLLYKRGEVSWFKGLTQFSDWSKEEFNEFLNRNKFVEFTEFDKVFKGENVTAPESIDWRAYGAVTEVKNQGTCGSCWSFSANGKFQIRMKFFICLAVMAIGASAISEEELITKYRQYQEEFDKSYRSPLEYRHRLGIFKQNLQEIEEHNFLYKRGEVSWFKGLTQFSDWSKEEFNEFLNRNKFVEFTEFDKVFNGENVTAPESIDWRAYGAVTEVKNQGTCGSCWSFSATGALEGAAVLHKKQVWSLSEQNLMDCATDSYNNHGCNGGNQPGAFRYVRDKGITTEQNYPYIGTQGSCQNVSPVLYATGLVRVNPTEEDLLKAVGSIGPVSVSIVSTDNLGQYKGGILDDPLCAGKLTNHAVLVVGYGSENGKDYWIVKNSWGSGWGEKGYWRLIRGKNSCSVGLWGVYPEV